LVRLVNWLICLLVCKAKSALFSDKAGATGATGQDYLLINQ